MSTFRFMITVSFPNWSEALRDAGLPEKTRKSFEISIKWYLGFLASKGVPATVESAREFIESTARARKPEEWMLEQWRAALNWFFGFSVAEFPVSRFPVS